MIGSDKVMMKVLKDSDYTNTGDNKVKEVKEDKGSRRITLINKINELELELDIPHEKTLEIYKGRYIK